MSLSFFLNPQDHTRFESSSFVSIDGAMPTFFVGDTTPSSSSVDSFLLFFLVSSFSIVVAFHSCYSFLVEVHFMSL